MPHSTVAPQIHEALDIHRCFPPEIALNTVFPDLLTKPINFAFA
jgi:hypothetical protein